MQIRKIHHRSKNGKYGYGKMNSKYTPGNFYRDICTGKVPCKLIFEL